MRRLIIAAALVLSFAASAQAQPPANADPRLAPWFQSLRQPSTGISCCSLADCRQVDYRMGEVGYEALVEGKWQGIPQDKVLHRADNPTGRGVLCRTQGGIILCFVAANEV